MDHFPFAGLLVLGAVVAIVVIVIGAAQARKRREALAALAARLGWRFDPSHDRSHDERYRQFQIFRRGRSRSAFNTLEGTVEIDGRTFHGRMGDFRYKVTRQSGKSSSTRTYQFSYLILHPPFLLDQTLRIRPESVLDKLAGAIGFDDIDFESEEFSRRFHVKSSDKRFAFDVIHPQMMEFLLASSSVAVEIDGGCCCFSDGSTRWQPAAFERKLAWLTRFFELWPAYLIEQLDRRHQA